MKKLYIILVIFILFLIACNAVEDLVTEKEAPEVSPIQSDKGFTVDPRDTVTFSVTATNPGEGSLSYDWSTETNSFLGSNRSNSVIWKAPLSGGQYWIKVDVSNNDKTTTQTDEIEVKSPDNPYVNISTPAAGEFLVQGTSIDINFEAIHSNGISQIFVMINDSIIFSRPGHTLRTQSDYVYTWVDVSAPAGEAEIKIQARAAITDSVGVDSVNVTIEGILPGKTGG